MTETAYRSYIYKKAKKVKTKKQLDKFLNEIIKDKNLDYGKIVYAITACLKATLQYVDNNTGGITGFQASCIGWELIRELFASCKNNKSGMRLVNFDYMLYPQYEKDFQKTISKDTRKALQEQATANITNLKDTSLVANAVINHWHNIADGKVPFGYMVED